MADGRGTYTGAGDFWLSNSSQGESEAFTLMMNKTWGNLKFMPAYPNMDASDAYGLTSAQAESIYGYFNRWDGENVDSA